MHTSESSRPALPPGTHLNRYGLGLIVLAVAVGLLYYGREFFLPVVSALLLTMLLAKPMRFLGRLGLHRAVSAFVLVLALAGVTGGILMQTTLSVEKWMKRAPEATATITSVTAPVRESIQDMGDIADHLERAADPDGEDADDPKPVVIQGDTVQQRALRGALSALVTMVLTLLLLFFCLATGGQFMRRLVKLPRNRTTRRAIVRVTRALSEQLSRYLFTVTCMNAALAAAASAVLWLMGVEEFWVLGLLVGISNYIPYFGSIVSVCAIAYVSTFTAESLLMVVAPALSVMALNGIEAFFITPALLGMRLSLNPVFILLSILFWGAIWGIGGMFLAVPLLATIKVILVNLDDNSNRASTLLSVSVRRAWRARPVEVGG